MKMIDENITNHQDTSYQRFCQHAEPVNGRQHGVINPVAISSVSDAEWHRTAKNGASELETSGEEHLFLHVRDNKLTIITSAFEQWKRLNLNR
jgi:hypothetical protein